MFAEGIFPIGDGLLDIDEERLKRLLVPDDINEIYEVEQTPFARGKFAAVRRAIHKNSGVHFAAKFLKRRRRAQSSDKEIKHEIAVLMLCNEADNIVKLNAVHESRSDTALLLELATGGELQTFLDNEECLNEAQARICMREVLKALQFLHKRSIVHLDLKPQNILLTGEHVEDGLKLCDFGISRVVTEGTNVREIVGTPDYVAPEVLQYEPLSLSTDIWSVGVLTYVLLSGFSPFGGETKQETFLNISQCALTFPDKLFGGVSSAAIDFIRKALRIKPTDRMTAAGCLEHIWLKDECNIDRHIFNNKMSNKQQLEQDDDDEQSDDNDVDDDDHASNADADEDVDVGSGDVNEEQEITEVNHDIGEDDDEVVEDVNVKDKPEAISVDNSEEEDDLLTSSTTYNNKHYTTNGHTNGHLNGYTNGHMNGHGSLINGHSNGFAKTSSKLSNGSSKTSSSSSTTTIPTTKTTAVHNVPASKAITIPLSSVQPPHQLQQHCTSTPTTTTTTTTPPQEQHQQQQFLHIPARRQSSDSNKENTFLTTKKIAPSSPSSGIKKTHSTVTQANTTTATIVINPTGNTVSAGHIVATITLPTAGSPACSPSVNVTNEKLINVITTNTATTNSFFPDAPTTPKVIRKAPPNSDTSPTSVKALVKKFQLESGEQPLSPPEFATNGSKQHMVAVKASETKTKFINGRPSLQNPPTTHSTAITINNTSRRASEPIAAVHTTKKLGMTSSSAPVSIPPLASNSFKSSCVYCNSCNAATNTAGLTSTTTAATTNGCRHPSSNTTMVHVNSKNGGPTPSCSANFSQSTKSLINGSSSSSNGSLTSSSSNATNTSTSSNALLFGGSNHQNQHHLLNSHHSHHHHHGHHAHHHHHHHLHHHGVVKSGGAAANGLSLDQGIIC